MPVTTRRWPTATQMAAKIMARIVLDNPGIANNPLLRDAVEASVTVWFQGGGHSPGAEMLKGTGRLTSWSPSLPIECE